MSAIINRFLRPPCPPASKNLQGIAGSVPWSALAFLTLYFQLLGMTDAQASSLVALFLLGRLVFGRCKLGGCTDSCTVQMRGSLAKLGAAANKHTEICRQSTLRPQARLSAA